MKKQFLALAALVAMGLTSCNKDNDQVNTPPAKPKTTMELLTEEKWTATYVTSNGYFNGNLAYTDVDTLEGMTVKFTAAGKVISYENNVPVDTSDFELLPNNQMRLDSLVCDLDMLSADDLKFSFYLQEPGFPVAVEEIFEFKK